MDERKYWETIKRIVAQQRFHEARPLKPTTQGDLSIPKHKSGGRSFLGVIVVIVIGFFILAHSDKPPTEEPRLCFRGTCFHSGPSYK